MSYFFFWRGGGGGWGGEICPCNSNIAYPRFEVYKTFLYVFMSNFMVGFRALRTVGKCTSRHLFRHGGLACPLANWFEWLIWFRALCPHPQRQGFNSRSSFIFVFFFVLQVLFQPLGCSFHWDDHFNFHIFIALFTWFISFVLSSRIEYIQIDSPRLKCINSSRDLFKTSWD